MRRCQAELIVKASAVRKRAKDAQALATDLERQADTPIPTDITPLAVALRALRARDNAQRRCTEACRVADIRDEEGHEAIHDIRQTLSTCRIALDQEREAADKLRQSLFKAERRIDDLEKALKRATFPKQDLTPEIRSLLYAGCKIEAVHRCRVDSGVEHIKEAFDLIENFVSLHGPCCFALTQEDITEIRHGANPVDVVEKRLGRKLTDDEFNRAVCINREDLPERRSVVPCPEEWQVK